MPYGGNFIKRVEILFVVISSRNHIDFSVLGFTRKGDGYLQETVWHERVRNNTLPLCIFAQSDSHRDNSYKAQGTKTLPYLSLNIILVTCSTISFTQPVTFSCFFLIEQPVL